MYNIICNILYFDMLIVIIDIVIKQKTKNTNKKQKQKHKTQNTKQKQKTKTKTQNTKQKKETNKNP